MNREDEYKLTLHHVVKWLSGAGGMDCYKPLSANATNKISDIVASVLSGSTLQQAVDAVEGSNG